MYYTSLNDLQNQALMSTEDNTSTGSHARVTIIDKYQPTCEYEDNLSEILANLFYFPSPCSCLEKSYLAITDTKSSYCGLGD